MRLGPDGFSGIAILGTAPSSMALAPFDNQEWAIWGCSPGAFPICAQKRSDVWFELHRWLPYQPGKSGAPGTRQWFSPEYTRFLQEHKGPVIMTEFQESIPNCTLYPYQDLLQKFGPYHFTSTISLMLAYAIDTLSSMDVKNKRIGLFGIDMAAGEEWAYQRPGCQHFVGLAKAYGIEVVIPPESDLMRHSTIYGIGEHNHRHVKLRERLMELEEQKNQVVAAQNQNAMALYKIEGAISAYKNFLELWSDDLDPQWDMAVSFSGQYVRPVGSMIEK